MDNADRKKGWQARARVARNAENRKAGLLQGRGWLPVPPELAETVLRLMDQAGIEMPVLETSNPR